MLAKQQEAYIAKMPQTMHVFGARSRELAAKDRIAPTLDERRGEAIEDEIEEGGREETQNGGGEVQEEVQEVQPQDDPMDEEMDASHEHRGQLADEEDAVAAGGEEEAANAADQRERSRSNSPTIPYVNDDYQEDLNDELDMNAEVREEEEEVEEQEVIQQHNDGNLEDVNDDEIITDVNALNAILDGLDAGGEQDGFNLMNNDDGEHFRQDDYEHQDHMNLDDVAGEEEVVGEEFQEVVEGRNNDDNDDEEGAESEGVDSDEAMDARRRFDAVDKLRLRRSRNSAGEYAIVGAHGRTSSSQSRYELSNGDIVYHHRQTTTMNSGPRNDYDQPSTSSTRRRIQPPAPLIGDYELQRGDLGMVPRAWSNRSSFDDAEGRTGLPATPDEDHFMNRFSRSVSIDVVNDDDEVSRGAVELLEPPKKRGRGRPRKSDGGSNQIPRAAPISPRKVTGGQVVSRGIAARDSRYPTSSRRTAAATATSSTETPSEKSSRSSADIEDDDGTTASGTPDPLQLVGTLFNKKDRKRKSKGANGEGGEEAKKKRRGRAPISAEQKERAMRELLEGPEVDYIDEVEFPTWLNYDQPVMYTMKAMLRFNSKKGLKTVRIRTQITERDIESIRRRLKIFGKDWEKSKKKPNQLLGRHHFNGKPYESHPYYQMLGIKEESRWTLQFFQASDERKKKSQLVAIPPYISLKHNETAEMPEYVEVLYDFADVSKVHCDCDMAVGCQPDTCACMKKSSLRKGIIVDTLLTAGSGSDTYPEVYECCEKCSCRGDADKCESVVQFRHLRFQAVHTEAMGYALRVMQPVERGEPVLDFTGVRQSIFTKTDQNWSYTCANGGVKYYADLVGMAGEKEKMAKHVWILNPLHKGNAARHICHSYWPNVEWCNVRRGGLKTTDPECIVYALEPLAPGDLLYLNYGKSFGIERDACGCTQELCHAQAPLNWFKTLTFSQAMKVLVRREKLKRTWIVKTQAQAVREVAEEDFAACFRNKPKSQRKLAKQREIEGKVDAKMREKREEIERARLQKIEDDRRTDIAVKVEPVE